MKQKTRRLTSLVTSLLMSVSIVTAPWGSSAAPAMPEKGSTAIVGLTTNYDSNPIGIGTDTVRFGWKMQSNLIGQQQDAYEITVKDSSGEVIWQKSEESSESVGIRYEGPQLNNESVYSWTVTVTGQDGARYCSEPAFFETGCDFGDAEWIIPQSQENGAPMFRTEFELESEKIASARLYITTLGVYDAYINGSEVQKLQDGELVDDTLAPGWTDYDGYDYTGYINYQTYDVTSYLNSDEIALGVMVGDGWYKGEHGRTNKLYLKTVGDEETAELALLAKLVVNYTDGSKKVLVTNQDDWKTSDYSPVLSNDFYLGTSYDARIARAIDGWNQPGYNDSAWTTPEIVQYPGEVLPGDSSIAYFTPQYDKLAVNGEDSFKYSEIVPAEEDDVYDTGHVVREPVDVHGDILLKAGETLILDLGQNISGVTETVCSGEEGTVMTIRHAEMLNDGYLNEKYSDGGSDGPRGTLYTVALKSAANTDRYVFAGGGQETFLPPFAFRGFRYVEITATDDITVHSVKGRVITSIQKETGSIETSDAQVNQLFSNAKWSQIDNYLSIPTDCPQRAERRGWTGDAQIFAQTGLYNFDSVNFLENYLDVLNSGLETVGFYRYTAPAYGLTATRMITSGWSDAGVVIPWTLYRQTGDAYYIEEYYDNMCTYMQAVKDKGYSQMLFGDWLSFYATSLPCINQIYRLYTLQLMSEMAAVIGETEDAAQFDADFAVERTAFIQKYVDANGNLLTATADNVQDRLTRHGYPYVDNAQCGLLWALKLGLYDTQDQKEAMVRNLILSIANENQEIRPDSGENTLAVGFLGVNVILPVLSEIGELDTAYDLLLSEGLPSWLYSVTTGATTIWERWDSYTFERSFGTSGMNSFNHYAYGSCIEWMYSHMAGITQDDENPGFKKVILQPSMDQDGRIHFVNGSYDSYYGTIESNWTSEAGKMTSYRTVIPANTTATLYLPVEDSAVILNTKGAAYTGDDIRNGQICSVFELTAGGYDFSMEDGVITVNAAQGYVDASAPVKSVDAPETAQVGTNFVVKVITADSVTDVRLYNEYDMVVGPKSVAVADNGDGTKTWALILSAGTVGSRTFRAVTKGSESYYEDSGVTVSIEITSVAPVLSSFDLPETAVANRTFIVKATTDMAATKISVYNEFGAKMGLRSLSYKVVDGQKVWTGVMAIGTKGDRTFTATAVNKYGVQSEAVTDSISVRAYA